MVDTNVIISAILKEGSNPDIVLTDVCENHELILCDDIIQECYAVANKRFPQHIHVLDELFAKLRYELVSTARQAETKMRDPKDQPILNASTENNVDVLISGDKHFLELEMLKPQICTLAEYKDRYIGI